MNYELIGLLTAIMLFCFWFYYVIGSPLARDPRDVDQKAILFNFPLFLAHQRLRSLNLLREILFGYISEQAMTKDLGLKNQLKNDHRLNLFLKGREFFTWERSLLCPVCLHWWLTVIAAAIILSLDCFNARADFFIGVLAYLVNHLIIRKIN